MEGVFDLPELQKRIATMEADREALEALLERPTGPIEVDEEVLDALVDVFSSWTHLRRDQKRAIVRDYQIRVRVSKAPRTQGKRSKLDVASLRIGVFRDDFSIYKKMQRLRIE